MCESEAPNANDYPTTIRIVASISPTGLFRNGSEHQAYIDEHDDAVVLVAGEEYWVLREEFEVVE